MSGSGFRVVIVACLLGVLALAVPQAPAHAASATKAKTPAAKQPARSARSVPAKTPRKKAAQAPARKAGAVARKSRARTTTARARQATPAASKTKTAQAVRTTRRAAVVRPVPTIGQVMGLRQAQDPLALGSSVALVVDARNGQTLYEKNADAVLPIASISKLLTAMVVIDSKAPMSDMLTVTRDDIDTERHSSSRLAVGARLSRDEMLQLALMASENRAANALGRHHPGGLGEFVAAMNRKARAIGMTDSHFVEPTGLSVANVANAHDLVKLVREAARYPRLRSYSTASDLTVDTGYRQLRYGNTNRLVRAGWEIGIQKTGYISEAGRCLVMQTRVDGRPVVMVLLDADGSNTRFGDARRLRAWLEEGGPADPRAPGTQVAKGPGSAT